MCNRLQSQIVQNTLRKCKAENIVDVLGTHLRKLKLYFTETNKMYYLLKLNLIEFRKCIALLPYKINEDHFRIADPICGLRGDQIVSPPGQKILGIDVTVSNAVTLDIINRKGLPIPRLMAK